MIDLIRTILKLFFRSLRKPTLFLVLGIIAFLYVAGIFIDFLPTLDEIGALLIYSVYYFFLILILLACQIIIVTVIIIDRLLVHLKIINYILLSFLEATLVLFLWLASTNVIPSQFNPLKALAEIDEDKRVQYNILLQDSTKNYFIVFENDSGLSPYQLEDGGEKVRVLRTTDNNMLFDYYSNDSVSQINFKRPNNWYPEGFKFKNHEGYFVHAYFNADSIRKEDIDSLILAEIDKLGIYKTKHPAFREAEENMSK